MSKSEYVEYLKSDEWREKRKEFLENEDYECEECGEKATQVHHLNYSSLGDEEVDDVMVLCSECHSEIHDKEGARDGYGEWM